MSGRQLVAIAFLGGAGWLAARWAATTLPGGVLKPPTALPDLFSWPFGDLPFGDLAPAAPIGAPGDYQAGLQIREDPSGNLTAKNPRSSASGQFQFTKATWEKLGGAWGPDKTKAFGGLTPSLAEQQARFNALTAQNSNGLARAGVAISNGALYAAHVLGLPTALRVFLAAPSTNLANVVGSAVMAANPQFRGFSVGDFIRWAGVRS